MISCNPATLQCYNTFLTSVSQRKSLVTLYYQPGDIITTNNTCIDLKPCRHDCKPCFRLRHENLTCQEVRPCITTTDASARHYRQKEHRVTKDTVKQLILWGEIFTCTTLPNAVLDFSARWCKSFQMNWTKTCILHAFHNNSHSYGTNWWI